ERVVAPGSVAALILDLSATCGSAGGVRRGDGDLVDRAVPGTTFVRISLLRPLLPGRAGSRSDFPGGTVALADAVGWDGDPLRHHPDGVGAGRMKFCPVCD